MRAILSVVLMLAGCQGAPAPDGDGGPDAGAEPLAVTLFPAHHSTGVDGADPGLQLAFSQCSDPRIAEVEATLRLTREPSGEEVPITIVPEPDERECGWFQVVPSGPLDEGFYRLSTAPLPPGVAAPFTPEAADGSIAVRFHVGTLPIVRELSGCTHTPGTAYTVVFSEPMAPDTHEHVTIEGATCGPPTLDVGRSTVDFECSEAELATVTFRLDTAAIRTESGAALVEDPAAGGVYTFVPRDPLLFLSCSVQYPFWPIAE